MSTKSGTLQSAIAEGAQVDGQQWRQVMVVATQLVLLGIATTLSVFKPKRRIRWRAR